MFNTNVDFNKCDTNIPVIDYVRRENWTEKSGCDLALAIIFHNFF